MTTSAPVLPQKSGFAERWRSYVRSLSIGDQVAHTVTLLCAAMILAITCLVVLELYKYSHLPRQKFGWNFLFTQVWDPVAGQFGALPFIYGTIVTSLIALLIAVPTGLGCAIFLAELAPPRVSDFLTFLVELLAAVPSVIYGLLGVFLLLPALGPVVKAFQKVFHSLPLFGGPFYGVSVFSAGLILSLMIVPFIVSVSREVLIAVPREQREAALAVGASHWQATWGVVLPFAKRGIFGSVILALARALGETMAVTMVIGNQPKINASLFAPGYSIAAVIANEFTEATEDLYVESLIELGLVLFAVTFIVNGIARLLILSTPHDEAN
jgi:phosphate transport system permease protein